MYLGKKILGIILVRRRSTRLKDKMLLPFAEATIIETVIKRIQYSDLIDDYVLATSTSAADTIFEDIARKNNLGFFRGSETDVVGRMYQAMIKNGAHDCIVRICSDNPLLMPTIVDEAIKKIVDAKADIISPAEFGTYPFGYSMVVMTRECLSRINVEAKETTYREHVENYCFEHPEKFRILYQDAPSELIYPELTLSLDYKEDYERLLVMHSHIRNVDIKKQPVKLLERIKKYKVLLIITSESMIAEYESIFERLMIAKPTIVCVTKDLVTNSDVYSNYYGEKFDLVISELDNLPVLDQIDSCKCIVVSMIENRYGLFYKDTYELIYYNEIVENIEDPCEYLRCVLPVALKKLLAGPVRPLTYQIKNIPEDEKRGKGIRIGFQSKAELFFPSILYLEITSKCTRLDKALNNKIKREIRRFGCQCVNLLLCDDEMSLSEVDTIKAQWVKIKTISDVHVYQNDISFKENPFTTLFIAATGHTYVAYDSNYSFGSLADFSLFEIWRSSAMRIERINYVNRRVTGV